MEYRTLGRTGFRVSAISLGTEYLLDLPQEHVAGVVREAIRLGVNYFDLFYANPTFRDNLGAALAGQRDGVHLAAHLGATDVDGQAGRTNDVALAEHFFQDFLRRYHTDQVDVLFVHNIDLPNDYTAALGPGGLLDAARRHRDAGRARAIGLSSHTVETALRAVETGAFDVLMFPINLAGQAIAGQGELLATCARRGVGVVAMKPYAGGRLLRPEHVLADAAGPAGHRAAITPVMCMAYVLGQTAVATAVPGCADVAQLHATQAYWQATEEEKDYRALLAAFATYRKGECVYCNHCLPCPMHIDIGKTIYELELAQGKTGGQLLPRKWQSSPASDCVECGACDARCPFAVGPMAKVRQAAALLGG